MSILDEVHAFLGRFISYPSEEAHTAHTLWIAHTHFMDEWESTPRLAFLSPEPGSGKTRALEITELLVPNPEFHMNMTPAYVFRRVGDKDRGLPTLLFDEIDTVFGPKTKHNNEELRALINTGHRRGTTVGRCVAKGTEIELVDFPAYAPVALAGLGRLPDTILTRSVVVRMKKRKKDETVEPYRDRIHRPEGHKIREALAAWAAQVKGRLVLPEMPEGIEDRDADVWEPLLAVADLAGEEWSHRASVTAVTLVTVSQGDRGGSLGVRLLADLRTVFGEKDKLFTTTLLNSLISLEESPWSSMREGSINSTLLANLLGDYGVSSKTIRIGTTTLKGYYKRDFVDAWDRYCPTPGDTVTDVTGVTRPSLTQFFNGQPANDDWKTFDPEAALAQLDKARGK